MFTIAWNILMFCMWIITESITAQIWNYSLTICNYFWKSLFIAYLGDWWSLFRKWTCGRRTLKCLYINLINYWNKLSDENNEEKSNRIYLRVKFYQISVLFRKYFRVGSVTSVKTTWYALLIWNLLFVEICRTSRDFLSVCKQRVY